MHRHSASLQAQTLPHELKQEQAMYHERPCTRHAQHGA